MISRCQSTWRLYTIPVAPCRSRSPRCTTRLIATWRSKPFSTCQAVRFHLTGNTLERKQLLRKMFDNHFRRVHIKDSEDSPFNAGS
jgi:hypothetical protein